MRKLLLSIIGLSLLIFPQFTKAVVFTDVASNHPNYLAITYLQENGIVEGYSDGSFRPEQKVNRAEALKILLLGSDVFVPEVAPQDIFPDVLHETWYGKYVLKAKNLTIVKGDDGTGLFRPGDTVNLAEALKMMLKTNNNEGVAPFSNPYYDVSSTAWFAPYFEYARLVGLLDQSSSENVYPATPVTRALLAELMYRLATNDVVLPDGKASYYGEKFHGRTTANGEIFDASAFTAAHRTYPFDTWLKVTNAENNKFVVVRVNDRGPYADTDTRIIDLSKAAFETISPLSRGIIDVKLEVTTAPVQAPEKTSTLADLIKGDLLNPSKSDCPEVDSLQYISTNAFDKITLDNEIPTRMVADEVLTLSGTSSSSNPMVSAFTIDSGNEQTAFSDEVEGGRFSINIRFPKTGTYRLGILPGESGSSAIREIIVLKNTCIEEVELTSLTPVNGLTFDMDKGDTLIGWSEGYDLYKLTFAQGGLHKSYILHGLTEWRPVYREFVDFNSGDVDFTLRGSSLLAKSILEPVQIQWSPIAFKTFLADTHHEYNVNEDEVDLLSLIENAITKETITASFKPKVDLRLKAAVILPSGKVHDIELVSATLSTETNPFNIEVFPASSKTVTASYRTEKTGVHFLEVNNAEGLAAINVPIYIRNQFPLLPSPRDLTSQEASDLGDTSRLKNIMLGLVNSDRNEHQLPALKLDNNLSLLAQYRSDDMSQNNYFGHWDSDGRSANDLRSNYGIQPQVSENLAKDTTVELAQYGLMRSAIHRSNIISDEWTRVGFGISKADDDSYLFVQVFSTDPIDMDDLGSMRGNILSTINDVRSTDLTTVTNLDSLAQSWSQKMADEDFFDFSDTSGTSLIDTVRDDGVTVAMGTYIMGNSSFADMLILLEENVTLQETRWNKVGIGIVQDSVGIIKVTLIYTE